MGEPDDQQAAEQPCRPRRRGEPERFELGAHRDMRYQAPAAWEETAATHIQPDMTAKRW